MTHQHLDPLIPTPNRCMGPHAPTTGKMAWSWVFSCVKDWMEENLVIGIWERRIRNWAIQLGFVENPDMDSNTGSYQPHGKVARMGHSCQSPATSKEPCFRMKMMSTKHVAWVQRTCLGPTVPETDPLNGNRTGPAARDSFNKSSLSSDVVGICWGERSEASFNE